MSAILTITLHEMNTSRLHQTAFIATKKRNFAAWHGVPIEDIHLRILGQVPLIIVPKETE